MENILNWYRSFFRLKNNYLFIALFASLLVLKLFIVQYDFSISNFKLIIPSSASFDNFDVGSRVNLFYVSAALFSFCLLLFAGIFYPLHKYLIKDKSLTEPWFFLSLSGILIMFFELTGSPNPNSLKLILILFPGLFFFQLFTKYIQKSTYNNYLFLWLILLSLSISFFSREMYFLGWGKQPGSFTEAFIYSFSGLLFIISLLVGMLKIPIDKLFFISLPLFLSALLSVVSDEAYLISNNYNLLLFSDEWFFILTITLAYLLYAYIYFRFSNNTWTLAGSMRRFVIPFSLLGILFFLDYRPFMEQPTDLFELANPANALMRIFVFHEWPFAEFISSHLLSEIFFPIVYTLLNGYTGGVEFLLYNFIQLSLMVFIAWYFLSRIFSKPLAIFGVILILPAIGYAFPGYHAWAFLTIFIIYYLVRHYTFKRLLFLISFNLLLLFWKVEIGISSIIATSIILIWYFIVHFQKKLINDYLKVFAILGGMLLIAILYFVLIRKIDLFDHFLQARAYFGASQEHGFSILSFGPNKFYYFHYFIFPLCILVLLFTMLFRVSFRPDKEKLLLFLSLFFLSIYYLVNAQRGLVRHSLTQNADSYISSILYLILPLFLYYFLKPGRKAMIFSLLLYIFLIQNFKVPELKKQESLIENLEEKFTEKDQLLKYKKKINRLNGKENFELSEISGLKKLMDNNFSEEASFIDFSNSPMLYYYTQRRVPSYFCQYMQNTITPYLQNKNIEWLKTQDLPIVVFSNIPETFFDHTDGIPNIIRYKQIRQYIYNNYVPLGKINNHYIWVKTGLETDTTGINIEDYHPPKSVQNLKLFPYLKAKEENALANLKIIQEFSSENNHLEISIPEKENQCQDYLLLKVENKSQKTGNFNIICSINNVDEAVYNFDIKTSINSYLLELSSIYSWIENSHAQLILQYDESNLDINSLQLIRKNS